MIIVSSLISSRAVAAENLSVLRTVAEVRALSNEQAARGYPVHLKGVITFAGGQRGLHFVADSTGGIYLECESPGVQPGNLVEIRGRSRKGKTVPYIDTTKDPTCSIVALGDAEMPEPVTVEAHQLQEIRFDAQFVRVDGRVELVTPDGDGASIAFTAGGRTIAIKYPGIRGRSTQPTYLEGLKVSATGVLGLVPSAGGPQPLHVGSLSNLKVDSDELEKRFSGEELLDSTNWNGPTVADPLQLYRTKGRIVYVEPRVGFFLSFAPDLPSIWVYSAHAADFEFGQHVEVVGKLDSSWHPRMRDAAARALPSTVNRPLAIDTRANNPSDSWYGLQGRLITVDLPVLSVQNGLTGEQNLILKGKWGLVLGRVKQSREKKLPVEAGSIIRVVGVCVLKGSVDLGLNSDTFWAQIMIRGPGDIQVLEEPPFWTDARLRWLVYSVLGVSAFSIAWIVTLRRRVHSQITTIGGHLKKQAIHEERARIAREWHDTLQQQLIGVSIQIQAAAAQCHRAPERAIRMLERADAMLRHSQTEARRSVWNLRNAILERQGLAEALKELRLSEPGEPSVVVRSSGDSSRRLPAETEFHLLRIAQEAVANALRHAGARTIQLVLEMESETITLSIEDDGCGFDMATVGVANGTHFGLLGMKERAAKIAAQLVIVTAAGQGTKTTVTVKNKSFPYPTTHLRS